MRIILLVFFSAFSSLASVRIETQSEVLSLSDGYPVKVTISKRVVSKEDKYPVLIIFGGFTTGDESLGLVKINHSSILATFDYPYKSPQNRGFFTDLSELPKLSKTLKRTDEGVRKLVKYLVKRKDVDVTRIAIVGVSFGAPIALYAGAVNPEISAIVMAHGFAKVDKAISKQLANVWCPKFMCEVGAFLAGKAAWWALDYHEPVEVLKSYPAKPLLIIYPEKDDQVPKESIESLISSAKRSNALTRFVKSKGSHITTSNKKVLQELVLETSNWLVSIGFLK